MTFLRFISLAGTSAVGALILSAEIPVEPAKNVFVTDEWKLPIEKPALKKTAGVEQITGHCLLCHSVDYVATQPLLLRTQWTATVEKMRGKFGATIPTNQVPAIVDYLTANYGRENPPK